jgi:uncharacterized protein (DUF849 family)
MVEHLRSLIAPDWPWSVCAIGRAQLALNAYCILAGGHVRTGLEDNLWFRRGERATNAVLVERACGSQPSSTGRSRRQTKRARSSAWAGSEPHGAACGHPRSG